MKRTLVFAATVAIAVAGCKKKSSEPAATSGAAPGGSAQPSPPPPPPPPAAPPTFTAGLATPESVLYDAANDRYLVSNINGTPFAVDDNGYIAVVAPDGKVVAGTWIDGAAADVTLNAPKGMAIVDGVLWVADITALRKFDLATGKPLGEVAIPGAEFLNDVAATADGGVVVTDTAVDQAFASTGHDAIYKVAKDGTVSTLIKDPALGGPNGVVVDADGSAWVVSFSSGELYKVDPAGAKQPGEKLPKGQLDGVIALPGGDLLVSSWEGSAVYRGKPGGPWTSVVDNVKAPADIGWDSKRGWVLVPLFTENQVRTAAIAK
ncbi:MAG: hypothetical protein R3B06_02245 [Kofleriaceae bacterium]